VEEVLPQVKLRVDPQVSLTQSHEGRDMQDPWGSQEVKLKVVIPQKWVEEPMRWHAESLLIERNIGHHISLPGVRNAGSFGIWQALSSAAATNSCFMSFCRWPGVMVEGVQFCPAMAPGRREGNTFEVLVFLPISFFPLFLLFSSLFLFSRCREWGKERTVDGAPGYRGAQGWPLAPNPTTSVVK
jgi:hypothetical protein